MAAKKKTPARRRPAKVVPAADTLVKKDGPLPLDDAMQLRDLEYCNKRLGSQLDESQRILNETRAALKALALIFGRQRGSGY